MPPQVLRPEEHHEQPRARTSMAADHAHETDCSGTASSPPLSCWPTLLKTASLRTVSCQPANLRMTGSTTADTCGPTIRLWRSWFSATGTAPTHLTEDHQRLSTGSTRRGGAFIGPDPERHLL